MINPVTVINAIISTARSLAITQLIETAKRDETAIKILTQLGLKPQHPQPDFETVYAYTLVKYGVDKISEDGVETTEGILQLFRETEIKQAFENFFYAKDNSLLAEAVKNQINWQSSDWNTLGDTSLKLNGDLRKVLTDFSEAFINVVKLSQNPGERMSDPKIDNLRKDGAKISTQLEEIFLKSSSDVDNYFSFPEVFEALIKKKIERFCGRRFVFQRFAQFLENNPKGYFTVVGDGGMGKSAIAAKYVSEKQAICYFNILVEGNNQPEKFLDSIRRQLINRYRLQDVEKASLVDLLTKVTQKLVDGERLVLVVDALDEVEQVAGQENILYLPKTLPRSVYFLLTRRSYEPSKKRLYTEGVPMEELDLKKEENQQLSREDVKEYIYLFLSQDTAYRNALNKWIQDRKYATDYFVEQIADKSQNNFLYLSYVVPAIAKGDYDDRELKDLPEGLQQYYQNHWDRMGMDTQPKKIMVIILFILVSIGTPISCETIAGMAQQDEFAVQVVLDEWTEYLNLQEIEGDICYTIYHATFLDFLKGKTVLEGKRKLFKEVNQQIVEYWEKWEKEIEANDTDYC